MLVQITCNKLAKTPLKFGSGLNAILGADDGTNSIGKSSVLMLIDFVFSGDDFVSLCAEVIENVGHLVVGFTFRFEGKDYSFSRSTETPEVVVFHDGDKKEEKAISDYRALLVLLYKFPDGASSLRDTVNLFSRIWGKENYNPNRPLNSFPNEPFVKVRSNLIKLFGFSKEVREQEQIKSRTEKKKRNLKGAFEEDYIRSITKRELKEKKERLELVKAKIEQIKEKLGLYAANVKQVVNDRNFELKSAKDLVLDKKLICKNRLVRIENNLNYGNPANKKYFDKLSNYFPNVDLEKLNDIEKFHSGVTHILKTELETEKSVLIEQISFYDAELQNIDEELQKSIGSVDKPTDSIDRLLELAAEEKSLSDQIHFRVLKDEIDTSVEQLAAGLSEKINSILSTIEKKLNKSMVQLVTKFYPNEPAVPELRLTEENYRFNHNSDSGTGKSYANLIALDLSFLKETYLPFLIHDSILFKNIEVHAVENIISEYSLSRKQIFISIDEVRKYNQATREVLKAKVVMQLGPNIFAFGKSWKKRA